VIGVSLISLHPPGSSWNITWHEGRKHVNILSISEGHSKIVLTFKAVLAVLINPPLGMKL